MRNFIQIDNGKIITTYADKVHGTFVPAVYKEVEQIIDLGNDKKQTVVAKELVRVAYWDISNIQVDECIEVSESVYREILDNEFNFYDTETKTFSKKDFRTVDEILNQLKIEKIEKVNSDIKALILSGFTSSALGDSHKYQSDETDQLNLIGAVTSGVDQAFKCSSDDGITWEWKLHTIEQLQTVLKDGAIYKNKLLEDASILKSQIQTCITLEGLSAIEV